jgi:hypothetical protein
MIKDIGFSFLLKSLSMGLMKRMGFNYWEISWQFNRKSCNKTTSIEINNKNLGTFNSIKIVIDNQLELPAWRNRKGKKPMVMIDEIELYNK